jgi:hypothetical protein
LPAEQENCQNRADYHGDLAVAYMACLALPAGFYGFKAVGVWSLFWQANEWKGGWLQF